MHRDDIALILLAFLLMSIGLLLSVWPLVPAGILMLAFEGHTALAVVAGFLADLTFGAPLGILSYVHFPFLIVAVLCIMLRVAARSVMLPRGGSYTL